MREARPHAARFERAVRADLVSRRWMRWHSTLIAAFTLAACWGASAGLMHAGVESLALRWTVALAAGYAVFLGLLWLWARWLLSRDEFNGDVPSGDGPWPSARATDEAGGPAFDAAGGGDFAGGGADASFEAGGVVDGAAQGATELAGQATQGAIELAAGADEGIVVAVPLALVFGLAVLIAGFFGAIVAGVFGVEVLLGVAVEIAFASAAGAVAFKARREGWLLYTLRRTAWPVAGLAVVAAVAGFVVDAAVPQARSLPHAVQLLRASPSR
jgi:hypothetical protein